GQRLMHIEDEGARSKDYGVIDTNDAGEGFRSSRSRALSTGGLRFHTDRCDVVSLICISQAARGGHSKIASIPAIHNALLARRPDLLDELFTPYPRSRFGEEASDASVHYMLPVFAIRNGKFTSHYSRTYIEASQTNPDVPRLRDSQNEALDVLNDIATELCYEMTLQPGDIQLLNNHVIYHARDPFEDDLSTGQKRLLLRLWLAMPNSRALPDDYEVLFGHTAPGALRGGIWPPGKPYQLPL
ncbi:MAG: TauD/TfdA family dioxygenase, partial [Hyphomicrobiaceae bacterium]